jgi:hypothetical protein
MRKIVRAICDVSGELLAPWLKRGVELIESGGEGRDSNPRAALTTAASELAAALASGDLSSI